VHLHVGFMFGLTVCLYVLAFFGVMKIAALRFSGHPLADAILEVY
jgi:hypothetical protein